MNRPAIRIRAAALGDIPALMRMKRAAAEIESAEREVVATEADWRCNCFGERPRVRALVAEGSGEAVGMATYTERYSTGLGAPALVVIDLFVDPAWRRRGVGRRLLAAVGAAALEAGSSAVELSVRKDNPAQRLYRKVGLRPLRDHLTYYATGPTLIELAARLLDF